MALTPRPGKLKILETARKQIKRDKSGNLTQALIASLGEGLIILDEYGHIDQINQPALDMLGMERSEIMGSFGPKVVTIKDKYGEVIPTDQRPAFRALLTGQTVTEIVSLVKKDGSDLPLAITAAPFVISDKPKGVILLYRDITEEMKIERAKDEFVSVASHQLRSPLTSIRLFTELLQSSAGKKLSKKELRYIDKILFSTEKMIDLVTDFLNISRLELGQLGIKPQPTDLNELVRVRIEEVEPVAKASGVKLVYDNILKQTQQIPIDRDLLGQVIHNLLSNAIRYTRPVEGRKPVINVSLSKKARYFVIAISDNGIGIPVSARTRIYERFYRAENATRTDSEGTGIGLHLVKQIIEACGGKISFKSHEGKGTTFYVRIPQSGMKNN